MPSSQKRYPRSARVNEVMLEVLADELERMSDPRLELVTFTGVEVTRDLSHAKVFYSTMAASASAHSSDSVGDDAALALRAAGSHLRGVVGRQMRIRQVPRLDFVVDPGIVAGQRIEEILRGIHQESRSEVQSRDADGADEEGTLA